MALPASGAISLSDFNTELGITAGTTINMNDADVRSLFGLASGAEASFSDYYGASSVVDIALTIAANTNNYNIFSSKGGTYVAGKSNVTVTINSGVSVGSTSVSVAALDTGTGWASGDTITIVNNGTVRGRGGDGGDGGSAVNNSSGGHVSATDGGDGGDGGTAIKSQFATTITNNGTFAGGGGGGAGTGGQTIYLFASKAFGVGFSATAGGGGGGGAGISVGGSGGTAGPYYQYDGPPAGSNTVTAESGSAGTATAGGAHGDGWSNFGGENGGRGGGNGGGLGSAGTTRGVAGDGGRNGADGAAGAAGKYAEGNSNITWSTTGTRLGGVS